METATWAGFMVRSRWGPSSTSRRGNKALTRTRMLRSWASSRSFTQTLTLTLRTDHVGKLDTKTHKFTLDAPTNAWPPQYSYGAMLGGKIYFSPEGTLKKLPVFTPADPITEVVDLGPDDEHLADEAKATFELTEACTLIRTPTLTLI